MKQTERALKWAIIGLALSCLACGLAAGSLLVRIETGMRPLSYWLDRHGYVFEQTGDAEWKMTPKAQENRP